jgi:methylenetetrahydrofolate dehydrogenase (NADP+) / methenyltetrahydrofolate cyclohydrolase
MIQTKRIDGKAAAFILRAELAKKVTALKQTRGITPGLAVILVGNDPASEVYVRNKTLQTREAGMNSYEFKLPADTYETTLLAKIEELNHDPHVHGILVQLPLPKHLKDATPAIVNSIKPEKDVDGFTDLNVGRRSKGFPNAIIPCTPLGCMILLRETCPEGLVGKRALIIGRSETVGKPMLDLLLRADCTPIVSHSKTIEIQELIKDVKPDILVAAIGKPEFVKGAWLKEGAIVIDVGINRITLPDGKTKLVGDVDFESCQGIASAITPVPGGVGPMTIACLLENTYRAASK